MADSAVEAEAMRIQLRHVEVVAAERMVVEAVRTEAVEVGRMVAEDRRTEVAAGPMVVEDGRTVVVAGLMKVAARMAVAGGITAAAGIMGRVSVSASGFIPRMDTLLRSAILPDSMTNTATSSIIRAAPCRTDIRFARSNGQARYGAVQTKLAASSVLPEPL